LRPFRFLPDLSEKLKASLELPSLLTHIVSRPGRPSWETGCDLPAAEDGGIFGEYQSTGE